MGRVDEAIWGACERQGAALLGVLNVTPDSFFDGGRYLDLDRARFRVDQLLAEGADLLEIGAESSRPGAIQVPAEEQLRRAVPVLRYALERGALVSIDTTSPEVARETLGMGAHVINDVSCLSDLALAKVAASFNAPLILMHSRGSMQAQKFSEYRADGYDDVVKDVAREWQEARRRALGAGIDERDVWFDPGLGFHKSAGQSLELMRRLHEFSDLSRVLVLGASRKSFLGQFDGSAPAQRLGGSLAAALFGAENGAQLLRVHDVAVTRQALLASSAFRGRVQKVSSAESRGADA
jgi:dihydropteroate synthase